MIVYTREKKMGRTNRECVRDFDKCGQRFRAYVCVRNILGIFIVKWVYGSYARAQRAWIQWGMCHPHNKSSLPLWTIHRYFRYCLSRTNVCLYVCAASMFQYWCITFMHLSVNILPSKHSTMKNYIFSRKSRCHIASKSADNPNQMHIKARF